jgi:hypothetical protein
MPVEILKKAAQRDLAPGPIFSKARNQRSIFSDSDIYRSVLSPLSRISSSHHATKPLEHRMAAGIKAAFLAK